MRLLVVAILLATSFSGCMDIWNQFTAPDADVRITPLEDDWNTDNRFRLIVAYEDPLDIRIELTDGVETLRYAWGADEATLSNVTYEHDVTIEIPDGQWTLTYYVDDIEWESFPAWIDTRPPEVQGLELLGIAENGRYLIGNGATYQDTLQLRRQHDGILLAHQLPYEAIGLQDGVHAYDIIVTDEAGNKNVYTVQIRAGDAKFLPSSGEFDFGIVARYTTELEMWDLTDFSQYADRSTAANQEPSYLGEGFGIEPNHEDIQAVVRDVVTPTMNTMEASWALYKWLFDELEYTEDRLDSNDLLPASETIQNEGGVCRDLAALYVSLARAAGIPTRLVTGYLAGEVNGFHAWVEIYAPSPGQAPWVPIDVSPIDGPFNIVSALGSFAIQRPDYLPLSTIEPSQEVEGWSTAIGVEYTYEGSAPEVSFGKELNIAFSNNRQLCIHEDTRARDALSNCQGHTHFQRDFPVQMEQTLDYGVEVSGKATTTAQLAYPATSELIIYGAEWKKDENFVFASFKS